MEYDALRHYKAVSQAYEIGIRIPDVSWSIYRAFAAQPDRAELVASRQWTAAQAREEVAARKALEREAKTHEAADLAADEGRFTVLYADPPWRYDFSRSDSRQIENQYPTISGLPIRLCP